MDQTSLDNIAKAEKTLGHATGIGLIYRGQCPRGLTHPHACMFCAYGHMLDCHYPKTCEEANCSHYQQEIANEDIEY